MTREQELLWKEVQKIQDYVVNVSLSKMSKYDDMEKLLNDVTYETIYGIMELLDGYRNNDIKCEVINRVTGNCINSDLELHNYCEEYLNSSEL